jgi:hypothetical protein
MNYVRWPVTNVPKLALLIEHDRVRFPHPGDGSGYGARFNVDDLNLGAMRDE